MAKSIVERELENSQKKVEENLTVPSVMNEVQKLLENDSIADRQMLKSLGMDTHLQVVEDMHDQKLQLEKLNEQFKGKIFSMETIKKLCEDYRLRYLKTRYYRGAVDSQIPAKIKELARECDVDLTNEAILSARFFILAPQEAFNLDEVMVKRGPSKLKQFFDAFKDPILFYQVDENHARMIHKWGGDFTMARAIRAWKWKSEDNFVAFGFLVSLLVSSVLFSAIWPVPSLFKFWHIAFIGAGTLLGTIIHYYTNTKNSSFIKERLSENCWNKPEKYRS